MYIFVFLLCKIFQELVFRSKTDIKHKSKQECMLINSYMGNSVAHTTRVSNIHHYTLNKPNSKKNRSRENNKL